MRARRVCYHGFLKGRAGHKQRDVVEMLNGMPMTQRPINRLNSEDDFKVKIMAAQAIQLKYDADSQMGLAVSS